MPKPKTPAAAAPVSDAPRTLPVQDLDTVWLPCAALTPWAKNPRKNAAAIPKVAASLRAFGFVAPVVVWKEGARMVAGHTRLAALQSILAEEPTFIPKGAPPGALPGMLPVRFHPFASEAEADAYGIADNRLNEIAEWNTDILQDLLQGMEAPLVDVSGFSLGAMVLPELPPDPTDPTDSTDPTDPPPPISGDLPPVTNKGAVVYHYDLVFADEAEQTAWTAVLKALRKAYPDGATHAARVLRFAREHGLGVTPSPGA